MKIVKAQLVSVPSASLEVAVQVAQKVSAKNGHITRDGIAVALGNSKASGNANGKVLAARRFGLVTRLPGGTYATTDLGRRCLESVPSRLALEQAVRHVGEFRTVVDELGWDLSTQPSERVDAALLRAKVSPDLVAEARRVLLRSAALVAGGQDAAGSDRVDGDATVVVGKPSSRRATRSPSGVGEAFKQAGAAPALIDVPIVRELLRAAPTPGSDWPLEQQDHLVEAIRHVIRLTYRAGA